MNKINDAMVVAGREGDFPVKFIFRVLKMVSFILLFFVQLSVNAMPLDVVLKTEANRMVEISFIAAKSYSDPFNQVTLDVIFSDPKGKNYRVPAFWDGGNKWKVRYSSAQLGTHHFKSLCSETTDKGLNGLTGKVIVRSYTGDNLLFKRGAIRVADDKRHFAYADGTPFFWLGDTWWMGLTKRLEWPNDVKELAADRAKKGFNVIQVVAGLYPDMPSFDPRGKNEAGFPWERDYSRIRPEYFDSADRRIMYLADQGFVPCVVGAWGYHLSWMSEERLKQHWRYIIARWAALPVVWIAAGETTMPYYLSTTKDADKLRQKTVWTDIIRYMHQTDPFHRLISTHPSRTARASVTDPTLLDFDMQQTGHGSAAPQQAALALEGWNTQPVMPVISGEARYEALAIPKPLPAAAAREAFWAHVINTGFAGHTYGANGVWQVNGREHPYGASPGGNNWGTTPWDKAMALPGSGQIGVGKQFIESLTGWNHLEPRPELVSADSVNVMPLCAAFGNRLRMVYLLAPGTVKLHSLTANSVYTATWFNTVSGKQLKEFNLVPDASGEKSITSPDDDHDWLLTIKRRP